MIDPNELRNMRHDRDINAANNILNKGLATAN